MYPSLLSDWVYMGDFLRLGAFACWLTGAAEELDAYWRSRADIAVHEERERVARELHDGLAQELAFVRSQTAGFATGRGRMEMLPYVAEAAERALQESRRAIAALTDPGERSLADGIVRATREVTDRAGVDVAFELTATVALHRETREALERIVREAVTNAVRHGQARRIRVVCEPCGRGVRLAVEDDGRGFDPGDVDGGYGLLSMRRRAERAGGAFSVRSAPGEGTTVEVVLA
jgi:signal transduction histidine kinase